MKRNQIWREEINVNGEALVDAVKQLIREGDIRRIVIKNEEGQVFMKIPLLIGAMAVVAVPLLAGVGTLGVLTGKLTIVVERVTEAASIEPINVIAAQEAKHVEGKRIEAIAGYEAERYRRDPHALWSN